MRVMLDREPEQGYKFQPGDIVKMVRADLEPLPSRHFLGKQGVVVELRPTGSLKLVFPRFGVSSPHWDTQFLSPEAVEMVRERSKSL